MRTRNNNGLRKWNVSFVAEDSRIPVANREDVFTCRDGLVLSQNLDCCARQT